MSIVTVIQGSNTFSELLNDYGTVVGMLTAMTKDQLIRSGILERIVTVGDDQ